MSTDSKIKKDNTKKSNNTKVKKDKKNENSFTTKVKNKVDALTLKQIFYISFILIIGVPLWLYYSKDKTKSNNALNGSLFGVLIIFTLGFIVGVISWIMK